MFLGRQDPGALQPPLLTDSFQHSWLPGPAPTGSTEREQQLLCLAESAEEAQQKSTWLLGWMSSAQQSTGIPTPDLSAPEPK